MTKSNLKLIRITVIILLALSYVFLLFRTWLAEYSKYYSSSANLILSLAFIVLLLLASFFFSEKNSFLISASVYLGIISIISLPVLLFRESLSIWRMVAAMITMTFFAPISPVSNLLPEISNNYIFCFSQIFSLYFMILIFHFIGKKLVK